MSTTYKLTHPIAKYCNTEQLTKHLDMIADMIEKEDQKWESSFRKSIWEIINDFEFTDVEFDMKSLFEDVEKIGSKSVSHAVMRLIALSEFCE